MNRREFVVAGSIALTTLGTLARSVAAQEKKQYVCPPCGCSHDGVAHNEPGNCAVCNMTLIEKTAAMSELTGIPRFLKLTDQVWTGGQPWHPVEDSDSASLSRSSRHFNLQRQRRAI